MKVGFAILSHDQPDQLLRLVKTLTAMFDAPPIACHHNFSQCNFNTETWPRNARFIVPNIDTKWGHISLPLAALEAFKQLRLHSQPDWFVLLSGSDYPVLRADDIIRDLVGADCDALLDHREIRSEAPLGHSEQQGFGRAAWMKIAYERYCCHTIWLPSFSSKLLFSGSFPFEKRDFFVEEPTLNRVLKSFKLPRETKIYGGDFWFQANQRAVDRLLDHPLDQLISYYRTRQIPDESFFHTALCNHRDLKICARHQRYSDWTGGGYHPKWLGESDMPLILASRAHFARKFRPNERVLEYVDRTVLGI